MNLQQMLDEALAHIDSMTADEFETECVKAGYTPVRKLTFNMSEKSFLPDTGTITYRHSVSLSGCEENFMLGTANDSTFQLAA